MLQRKSSQKGQISTVIYYTYCATRKITTDLSGSYSPLKFVTNIFFCKKNPLNKIYIRNKLSCFYIYTIFRLGVKLLKMAGLV